MNSISASFSIVNVTLLLWCFPDFLHCSDFEVLQPDKSRVKTGEAVLKWPEHKQRPPGASNPIVKQQTACWTARHDNELSSDDTADGHTDSSGSSGSSICPQVTLWTDSQWGQAGLTFTGSQQKELCQVRRHWLYFTGTICPPDKPLRVSAVR